MDAPSTMAWAINPDVVTAAIQSLVKVVGATITLMGGSLIGVLLYIWKRHETTQERAFASVKEEIGKVAGSLETISSTLFDRQKTLEIRISDQETRCEERSRAYGRRNND